MRRSSMSITSTYEVIGTETVDGHEVAAIEFTTETSEVILDLGEMFQGLFDAFGELGAEPGDTTSDTGRETPDITFVITVAPSTANGTVWFDQEAGIVEKYSQDETTPSSALKTFSTHQKQPAAKVAFSMLMDFSDAEAVVRTAATMDLDMRLTAELIEGPSA